MPPRTCGAADCRSGASTTSLPGAVRAVPAVLLACLVLVPTAAASGGYVEVVDPAGHVLASATGQRFDYPAGGGLVHVGRAFVTSAGVELDQVSLLDGAVSVERVVVPL